jgi:catechol 2,3-dioxygenase
MRKRAIQWQLSYRACLASSSHADLDRLAIHYPTRAELADALRRLRQANIPLEGASDHGVSEALYLRDPDQNGVELYWDNGQAFQPSAA